MIYWPNGGMYFICTSSGYYFNLIYDVKLTSVIFSELHHLRADLTHFYMYLPSPCEIVHGSSCDLQRIIVPRYENELVFRRGPAV